MQCYSSHRLFLAIKSLDVVVVCVYTFRQEGCLSGDEYMRTTSSEYN